MNIEKAMKEENERHEKTIHIIGLCVALCDLISFVDENKIFTKAFNVEDFKKALHEFKEKFGKYNIVHYYMSTNIYLAIVYSFPEKKVCVVMYCNDPGEMLNEISGGKCKIVKQQNVESKVVCEKLENNDLPF